jgi:hypothetical protein
LEPDIYLLQLAEGGRNALINGGFSTIKSILECTTDDISSKVGVDLYVAQIIFEEAVRIYENLKVLSSRSINFGNRGINRINRDRNDYWSGMLLSPSGNLSHTSILYYDYDLHHTISILNTIHGQNTIGKS